MGTYTRSSKRMVPFDDSRIYVDGEKALIYNINNNYIVTIKNLLGIDV